MAREMAEPEEAATFIVRLARNEAGLVRGIVERVRTGEKVQVRTVSEVAQVLGRMIEHREKRDPPRDNS
jgi:hypothetical protein